MTEARTLQARAWANPDLSFDCAALRYLASVLLVLVFSVSAAHAQSGSASNASSVSTGPKPIPCGQWTRARRVSDTSQPVASPAPKEANSSGVTGTPGCEYLPLPLKIDVEDPPAMPEQAPKSDRIAALRAQITETTDKTERARLQRTLVDYLIALNRQSEAIKELREMMRADRIDPVGFYNIGNGLARLGDTPTAIDAYRKAIEQRHGNYARALNNLGVLLIRQERWDEALTALSSALRLENFRYGEASYNLGRVYAAQGNAKLAIAEWTRALLAQPDHLDAALLLARALASGGEAERAVAVIDRFIERQGSNKALADARREILAGGANSAGSAPRP